MNPNLAGILAMLMWSSTALLLALNKNVPPFELGAISWAVGLVILAGYHVLKGEKIMFYFRRPASDYLFGSMGIFLYSVLLNCSFWYAPPFEAITLNYLWPVLLMVFLRVFQNMQISLLNMAGIAIAFLGSMILCVSRFTDAASGALGIGHVLAVLAAIIWSLYSCFAKTKNYPSGFMIPLFLVAAVGNIICHFLFEETVMPHAISAVVIVGLGCIRIAYVFWDYAIRNGDRVLLSSLSYMIPLASTSFLIAGGFSSPNIGIMGGGLLIVAGCLVVNSKALIGGIKSRVSQS